MSRYYISKSRFLKLALAVFVSTAAWAGTFGKVVSIGGHASDLALDEARGVLYVANFTANRVEVVSLADHSIQRSMNVGSQPGSLALSPDGKFLVITHFGNFQAPNSPNNAITVVNLVSGARQTFGIGAPPLGVAFGLDNRAFIATQNDFVLFDTISGSTEVLETVTGLVSKTLPQPAGTVPSQILATSMAVSGDGVMILGVSDKFYFRYDSVRHNLSILGYTSSPPDGPRAVSVNRDGSRWMSGWALKESGGWSRSMLPNPTGALNIGSVMIDSFRDLVYAQIEETGVTAASLQVLDGDNLTLRERLNLRENLSGKSVMSSDGSTMYAVSVSGVTVLPVGAIQAEARITATKNELTFHGNFCDRNIASQEVSIVSHGAPADFRITSANPGVRISPASGTTPATVRISVDPSTFQNQKGTVAVELKIESTRAVNQASPIRALINSREPDQRGNVIPIAGKLVDIVADPSRDRFFVLRQDRNEVLVFDATTFAQTATVRTLNMPKSMAITFDRRYLLVGGNLSAYISVYDLETLELDRLVLTKDYVQSIATSANAILIATRPAGGTDSQIQRVDLSARVATPLPTLGVFENRIVPNTVLVGSGNGRYILIAQGDGNLMLYDAVADTFTVSRKETVPLVGAYAASNYDQFAVGNAILNSSLVPVRRWTDGDAGKSSGFAFLDNQIGFRFTAPDATAPGVLQRVDLGQLSGIRPTRTSEAGLLGTPEDAFTRSLMVLPNRTALVALTTSGITVFPWAFDEGSAPPRLERIVNAADGTQPVAPGGLISLFGANLSPVSQASRQVPLPTILGESCLTVNGQPVPVMYVSPLQINAQLPFSVDGATQIVLRTPGGVSDGFNVTILPSAPSVFRSSVAGSAASIATVVRSSNGLLVTPSNPVHRGDVLTIYATGLGRTNPSVETGVPSPAEPLASAVISPVVTLGGVPMPVEFAGLTPGEVGVYQINVRIDGRAPLGLSVPLSISQGAGATAVPVRVVE